MVDYRITSENMEQSKTLIANSYDEGRKKLYQLYGNDYEILNRSTVLTGGFLGFFQKDKVKISYIVKDIKPNVSTVAPVQPKAPVQVSTKEISAFEKNKNELLINAAINNKLSTQEDKLTEIMNSLAEMKNNSGEKPKSIQKIEELLRDNDFTYDYINMITEKIKNTFSVAQLEDFQIVERAVVDWIGETIKVEPEVIHRRPNVVILVGPTGVGKTTTLVKLATLFFMRVKSEAFRPKVSFITADTMRVGALEQLERWGNLFDTEVLKAQNVHDVSVHYNSVRDTSDFIFIDTSGYSPNDASNIGKLKDMLDVPGLNPEIYLTVSATTKPRDLEKIIRNYEPFGYKSVIVTKCDESDRYGNIISVLHQKKKTISYITNGQLVTNTLQKADVVDFLIRLANFTVDRVHIEDKFGDN